MLMSCGDYLGDWSTRMGRGSRYGRNKFWRYGGVRGFDGDMAVFEYDVEGRWK